jgi:hypothetical protein
MFYVALIFKVMVNFLKVMGKSQGFNILEQNVTLLPFSSILPWPQCSAVQCSAVQCSAVQCSAVQIGPPVIDIWTDETPGTIPSMPPYIGQCAVQCAVQCSVPYLTLPRLTPSVPWPRCIMGRVNLSDP